tara:strand:- start:39 stop:596 length:558 start_codon:yes stop_codon:yes gene_type:complete
MDIEYAIMTLEMLKAFWEKEWETPIPITRKRGSTLNEFYPITHFIVAVHNNKPVGAVGYSQQEGFALYGQSVLHPNYYEKGIYSGLGIERDMTVNGPKIAGLVSQNPKFPQKEYEEMQRRNNFIINPTEEEIRTIFGGEYPEKTIQGFQEFYGNHPTGSWGIKKFDDKFSKSWIHLIKNYYPAGE